MSGEPTMSPFLNIPLHKTSTMRSKVPFLQTSGLRTNSTCHWLYPQVIPWSGVPEESKINTSQLGSNLTWGHHAWIEGQQGLQHYRTYIEHIHASCCRVTVKRSTQPLLVVVVSNETNAMAKDKQTIQTPYLDDVGFVQFSIQCHIELKEWNERWRQISAASPCNFRSVLWVLGVIQNVQKHGLL